MAFLVVEHPQQVPGAAVTVNGRALPNERWGRLYAVDPGAVTVDATAQGYAPFRATSTLSAGQQARVSVTLVSSSAAGSMAPSSDSVTVLSAGDRGALPMVTVVSQPPQRSPWRVVGLVTMSAGVALGVVGLLTGLRASSIRGDLDARCPQGCGPTPSADVVASVDEGRQMVLYTNLSWGIGGALLVGGAVAFFASGGSAQELYAPTFARNAPPRRAWQPYVDPARGAAGITGSF